MVKVMRCHQCQHDFSWDSGNPLRGNIFICEDCGEFVCYSCLVEHGYDVSNMDSILCLNCLKDKEKLKLGGVIMLKKILRELNESDFNQVGRILTEQPKLFPETFYEDEKAIQEWIAEEEQGAMYQLWNESILL